MKTIDHPRTKLFMEMKAALARITAFNNLSWETDCYNENKPDYNLLLQELLKAEEALANYDDNNPPPLHLLKHRMRVAEQKLAGHDVLIATDRFSCCGAESDHYKRQHNDAKNRKRKCRAEL